MEIPRPRVKAELQLLAYMAATEMQNLSHICDLHHSSRQHQILNLLNKAMDQSNILTDISQILFCCTTMGTPFIQFILKNTVFAAIKSWTTKIILIVFCELYFHVQQKFIKGF